MINETANIGKNGQAPRLTPEQLVDYLDREAQGIDIRMGPAPETAESWAERKARQRMTRLNGLVQSVANLKPQPQTRAELEKYLLLLQSEITHPRSTADRELLEAEIAKTQAQLDAIEADEANGANGHLGKPEAQTEGGVATRSGKPIPTLDTYLAKDIEHVVFPDPRFAVPGLLPEGLIFLAGPPKIGKSWLALNIALAVALNGKAIGSLSVEQGAVLYLGLEDNKRRMQKRIRALLEGGAFPDDLSVAHTATRLGAGLEETLAAWISTHENARLIVIDTLARVRPISRRGGDKYQEDTDSVAKLQALALKHGIAILCIHHTRKATSDDFLEEVSGTFGLTGAADAVLVLKRSRGECDATLEVTGRDIEELDLALSFKDGGWQLIGSAEEHALTKERKAILDLIGGSPVPLSPHEIAEALEKNRSTTRTLLQKLLTEGQVKTTTQGKYHKTSKEIVDTIDR